MALTPEQIRRAAIVLVRLPDDKSRPAVVVRTDILSGLPYATILPLTTELRPEVDFRITVEPNEQNGLRGTSQIMVDWPQTVRAKTMGEVIAGLMTLQCGSRQNSLRSCPGLAQVRAKRTRLWTTYLTP